MQKNLVENIQKKNQQEEETKRNTRYKKSSFN